MEKRKKTLLILGLCIFTLALVGLSYAFWQITLQQTDENVVYTSCLQFDFTDENDIHLLNAYPMTEEEQIMFFENETPYHFTIKNECASKANLSINLEVLPVGTDETQLDDEWVDVVLYEGKEKINVDETTILNQSDENGHYKLTASDVNDNRLLEESEKAYTLHNFTIEKNETKDFSMYLLLDEDTPLETEEGKKTTNAHWKGKVTINAAYKKPDKGMLRKIEIIPQINQECMEELQDEEQCTIEMPDTKGMRGYTEQITKIIIENTLTPHEDAEQSFDESAEEDNSVKSYLVSNVEEEGTYTAYIQADGKVKANYDSSYLFAGYGKVTEIDGLENLDTSKTENMSYMFALSSYNDNSSSIETLDVSSLDTSQVTDMSRMFYGMNLLTTLNLGEQFNTSKVTDMSYMFINMEALTELNLGERFDTSKVTDMSYMFDHMTNLANLDLSKSNFDTSNVTDMSYMFYNMESLTELNLGDQFDTSKSKNMEEMFGWVTSLTTLNLGESFDTSQVTNMRKMFYDMEALTTLDLSQGNFDTSNVTNMSSMFSNMRALTNLTLGEQFDTSQVTDMSGMFTLMSSLDTLDLSQCNFDTRNVTDMNRMFSGMTSLTTLNLGEHFNTGNVTDMLQMFYSDSQLNSIEYGNQFIHNENTDITNMFYDCPAPKPDANTHESWANVTWD